MRKERGEKLKKFWNLKGRDLGAFEDFDLEKVSNRINGMK